MNNRKLSAGDIIEARCTRCRQVLNHRIVAMVGEKVVRVECNTCGGTHNYYPPPSAKEAKTSKSATRTERTSTATPRTARKDQTEKERDEWEALKLSLHAEKSTPYDMNGRYPVNAIVSHPVFGLGLVKQLVPPNKMQVLFQDGIKLLRCR